MKKIHYAWFVCAGCSLLLFCNSGLAVNAFSIYQPYIISVNHFSNTQASSMIAFRNCASLLSMLAVGEYYKKLGMRRGMTITGAIMALAFALFGLASEYWQYCFAAALTGIGYGAGTMIPVSILIDRWFASRKDTAIGICSAMTGISTLGIPSLLSGWIVTKGLRFTFLAESLFIGVLVIVCRCLLRNSPEEMNTAPYGAGQKPKGAGTETSAKMAEEGCDLPRTELIVMLLMLVLIGGVMNVSYSHLTVLITGEGLSESVAAVAMSLSGLFLMLGKILYGRLQDQWGTVKSNWVFAPILLLGFALCCFIGKMPALIYPAIILYSFGLSSMSVGLSTWPSDMSSPEKRSRLVQIFHIIYVAGSLAFSSLPGILADSSEGSYIPAFVLFFILGTIVFISVQIILIRQKRRSSQR